jgi:hypothetical protein
MVRQVLPVIYASKNIFAKRAPASRSLPRGRGAKKPADLSDRGLNPIQRELEETATTIPTLVTSVLVFIDITIYE